MRGRVVAAVIIAMLGAQLVHGATGESPDTELGGDIEYEPGQVSVKFSPLLSEPLAQTVFATAHGLLELSRIPEIGWVLFEITDDQSVLEKVAALLADPLVENAAPNAIGEWFAFPQDPPNDDYWSSQWGPQRVGMRAAWQIAGGGNSSHEIAIVDSGVI